MGTIKDRKKFERKKTQNNPTNPSVDLNKNKDFDLENKTIKNQESTK